MASPGDESETTARTHPKNRRGAIRRPPPGDMTCRNVLPAFKATFATRKTAGEKRGGGRALPVSPVV
jgi:hypothetical protein